MNYELMDNNKVFLKGEVVSNPEFSHEVFGEGFYELSLKVKRLSENYDIIPITVSERLLTNEKFDVGKTVLIKGQFRSYNKQVDNKSKLLLTVFVRELIEDQTLDINPNIIELNGFVCKEPIYRTTPFKREICDVLLAVNRAYNKSDYLPCIAWGRNARFVKNIKVGGRVNIIGRIQSREYQKKLSENESETKTAYEISISKIRFEENLEKENIELNANETEVSENLITLKNNFNSLREDIEESC